MQAKGSGRAPVLAPQLHAAAAIQHLDQPARGSFKGAVQHAGPVRAAVHEGAARLADFSTWCSAKHAGTLAQYAAKARVPQTVGRRSAVGAAHSSGEAKVGVRSCSCACCLIAEGSQLRRQVHALVAGHHEAVGVLGAQRLPRLAALDKLDAGLLLGHGADDGVAGEGLRVGDVAEDLRVKPKSRHNLGIHI